MTEQKKYLETDSLAALHYGEEYEHYYNSIVPPVFMNSLNVFNSLDEYFDFDRRDPHTFCYGRVQNPTTRILEDKVAALEHGIGALAFASGMAASVSAAMAVLKTGGKVVCIKNAYGPLKDFFKNYCREHMKIETIFVSGNEVSEFENVITDKTDLVVLESPSSLVFSLQDIEEVSKIAHRHNAYLFIDNTYCTPLYQKPLDLGADIVMHTASKYMGGHSDLIGGMLAVKDEELLKKILYVREIFGGILSPMDSWLTIRGLRTMAVRLKVHNETALKIAEFLENHPKIEKVYYPGLKSHPQYELMKKQQSGNTGLLSFEIKGSTEEAKKLVDNLKIFKIGVSWGGFESLAFMPNMRLDEEGCKELSANQNLIRIHCGLEDVDILIEDLKQALALVTESLR